MPSVTGADSVRAHGQAIAEREAPDSQRDRSRGILIDQGAAEQFVGEMVVHVPSIGSSLT